jgi:hypothetical protein
MGPLVRDALVSPAAFALPSSAGSTQSASIDTGNVDGEFLAKVELLITAPALTVTQLPNSATVTYSIEHSADNSSWSTLQASVLVQTGAGGAGAAAATARYRPPTNVKRYIRLKATTATSPGDCSGVNGQLDMLF